MLRRFDPFTEVRRLQDEMEGWLGYQGKGFAFTPAVDIFEDKESISVRAELAGVKADDVHLSVENNVLTLRGERKLERAENKDGYHRIERAYGQFSRSFALPQLVDSEKIHAEMKDGVLTVRLPKKGEAQPRRVEVKTV